MRDTSDPWADLDHAVLHLLADGEQHDRREILRHLADIDARHVRVSLAEHVKAGRLVETRDAIATSYKITDSGLAHLQQATTLTKAA